MLNTAMSKPSEAPSLPVVPLQAGQLCGEGGGHIDLKRVRAAPGAGEGKAKTFNLLLAGPKVLNLCKLAETKGVW
jgi:hypothetical protein